jgi:endonuclease-3
MNRLFTATKRGHDAAEPEARPVLEHLIYGVCREGTTREKADAAFRALQANFFDWNEVRVSMIREVADVIDELPDAEARAQRIISLLQEIFETTFSFELDSLHKKGLKQAEKQLQRYQGSDPYVVAYTLQTGLGGHYLPLDNAMSRALKRLEVLDGEPDEAARASLEHLVPKSRGYQFCEAVSAVAHEFCHSQAPKCSACPMHEVCPSGQSNTKPRAAAKVRAR